MCIRDRRNAEPSHRLAQGLRTRTHHPRERWRHLGSQGHRAITLIHEVIQLRHDLIATLLGIAVSYTHLRAHETVLDIVCRLLLEKKKQQQNNTHTQQQHNKQLTQTQLIQQQKMLYITAEYHHITTPIFT